LTKFYEYKYFHNIQVIGTSNFRKVCHVKWKDLDQYLAIKSFFDYDKAIIEKLVHEVIIKLFFILMIVV
jgi:hypothetical protein